MKEIAQFNSNCKLYLMRVIFNCCWNSTHNTSIKCSFCGVGRNTWNIYRLLSNKSNNCTCPVIRGKNIHILFYFLSPNFAFSFPHHAFCVQFVDCTLLARHSDQWFVVVNSILEYSFSRATKNINKIEKIWCLKKNWTTCS
jgi:hypothetical protein